MEQKYIYVVFSSGNTGMSHFIKFITQNKYNHVALSFEKDLHKMYSFARYNRKAPLYGGMVEESILRYYLSGVDDVKICRIPVSEESLERVKERIERMYSNKEDYIYNTFSAMLMPVKIRYYIKKSYTCVEFVSMLLRMIPDMEIALENYTNIPMLEKALDKYKYYEGNVGSISVSEGWGNDNFSKEMNFISVICNTILHFGKLFVRL